MLKVGKYRCFRNIPIGWLTHANHGRDFTEKIIHWAIEIVLLVFVLFIVKSLVFPNVDTLFAFLISFFIIHTLWWVVNGNFHVYLLDSFIFVKNSGIDNMIRYVLWFKRFVENHDGVEAILIYGSASRGMFHLRSDLDLRVIRRKSNGSSTIGLIFRGIFARVVSLFSGVPTDLQIVDSQNFLKKQMRSDEKPIVVFCRQGFVLDNPGYEFSDILNDTSILRRNR